MRTLLRNGVIHTGTGPVAAMAVDDGRVEWLGGDDGARSYDGADDVVDLRGRWVAPAFVDAHAHTSQTGAGLRGGELGDASVRVWTLDQLREPEVEDLRVSVRGDEHVGRLQIAVDDPLLVCG